MSGTPGGDEHLRSFNEGAAHAEDAELDAEPDAADAARIPLLQRPRFQLAVVGVSMLVLAVRDALWTNPSFIIGVVWLLHIGLAHAALGPRAAARTQCIWLVAMSSFQLARTLVVDVATIVDTLDIFVVHIRTPVFVLLWFSLGFSLWTRPDTHLSFRSKLLTASLFGALTLSVVITGLVRSGDQRIIILVAYRLLPFIAGSGCALGIQYECFKEWLHHLVCLTPPRMARLNVAGAGIAASASEWRRTAMQRVQTDQALRVFLVNCMLVSFFSFWTTLFVATWVRENLDTGMSGWWALVTAGAQLTT